MRGAEEVLARARITSLVASLAAGTPVDLLRIELQRHALGIELTERENGWLWNDAPIGDAPHLETMRMLAWALGIEGDVDAIRDALDDTSLTPTLREESEVRAKLSSMLESDARHALRWTLDEAGWP